MDLVKNTFLPYVTIKQYGICMYIYICTSIGLLGLAEPFEGLNLLLNSSIDLYFMALPHFFTSDHPDTGASFPEQSPELTLAC